MSYRDDREALHNRVAQLEDELKEARAETDRAQEALREAKEEKARPKTAVQPRSRALVAVGLATVVISAAIAGLALRRQPPEPKPRAQAPLRAPAPERPKTPEPPEIPTAPPAPPPPARTATARWTARVTRAEGVPLGQGATCTIEATVATAETNAKVPELSVMCGDKKLYRSSDSLNGTAMMSNDARERLGASDDKSTFTLKYRDIGTRNGERAQIDLDTTAKQGAVFKETIPRFRVELSMQPESAPTPPLAGAPQRLGRTGKISEISGAPAPAPSAGASCVLRAMPTGKGQECVAEVACGKTILWPATEPVTCTYSDRWTLIDVAASGGPSTLSIDGTSLAIARGAVRASITLDER